MSWLSQVYCRCPCARSLNATLQKELVVDNGPDLGGFREMAEIGAVHCLGGQRVPDCIMVKPPLWSCARP